LVQTYELSGSVCNDKEDVVGRHISAFIQDSVACACEVLLWSPRKSVTQCSQSLGIKPTSTQTIKQQTGFDVVSFQNESGTDAQCNQQVVEM